MSHLVLLVGGWGPSDQLGRAAAQALDCRAIDWAHHPALDMYDLVVLSVGGLALLDPTFLLALAQGSFRGKSIAWVSAWPKPVADALLAGPSQLARCGGAEVLAPAWHHPAPGGAEGAHAHAEAQAFAEALQALVPAQSYPHADANWRPDRLF